MNRRPSSFFLLLLLPVAAAGDICLTNAHDMAAAILGRTALDGICFDIAGQVEYKSGPQTRDALSVIDGTGSVLLSMADVETGFGQVCVGDHVRARGRMKTTSRGFRIADCLTVSRISSGTPPEPIDANGTAMAEGKCDFRRIRITGIVRDVLPDDIDPHYVYIVVNSGGVPLSIPLRRDYATSAQIERYVGARVEVSGYCNPTSPHTRPYGNKSIAIASADDIRLLKSQTPADGPPDISSLYNTLPHVINALGLHKASGRVLAVWNGDSALLKTETGSFCKIRTNGGDLPHYGDRIDATGLPVTDGFRINLLHASWKKSSGPDIALPLQQCVPSDKIMQLQSGRPVYRLAMFGALLRLRGKVLNVHADNGRLVSLLLACNGLPIEVDCEAAAPSAARVAAGAVVDVCGTCVFDTDEWTLFNSFPKIAGLRIVLRHADDITTITAPPWWTPVRTAAVIGILLCLLTALGIWHLLQRHLARLRLSERTRLAVELHDSVSQNLTGVSMQIDTARQLAISNPDKLKARLDIASRTIDACREELRNCICDLRSHALDAADMTQAVRETLSAQSGARRIQIRFNVRRSSLTDSCAHAIIRIVRELVTNAIRHGNAGAILIAGTLDGDEVRFSVKDDGCGFSPETRPGVTEGHFGLDGIMERVRTFGGMVKVESEPGKGARIEITLRKALRK